MTLTLVAGIISALPVLAVEPWADAKLPVKDGLELWLSAADENHVRGGTTGLPTIPPNGALDTWHDSSGKKRHVRQPVDSARPRLMLAPMPAVHFDGIDDFLSAGGWEGSVGEITIFIRATPRSCRREISSGTMTPPPPP